MAVRKSAISRTGVSWLALGTRDGCMGRPDLARNSGFGQRRTPQAVARNAGPHRRRPGVSVAAHVPRGRLESRLGPRAGVRVKSLPGDHGDGVGGFARHSDIRGPAGDSGGPAISGKLPVGRRLELAPPRSDGPRAIAAGLLSRGPSNLSDPARDRAEPAGGRGAERPRGFLEL